MVRGIRLTFYGNLKMSRILKSSIVDVPLLVSCVLFLLLIKLYMGSSDINKVISTLDTLTSIVQNVNPKINGIESEINVVNSHSQFVAKLENQPG